MGGKTDQMTPHFLTWGLESTSEDGEDCETELGKGEILDVVNLRGLVWQNGRAEENVENLINFCKNMLELEMWIWETTTFKMVFTALMIGHTI